jgi:leader peptidase (prepilin peptidase)/N-methyltransferase
MAFLDLLYDVPPFFVLLLGGLGLLVGSFVNVVVHRLPLMMEREWRRDCVALLHPDDPPAADAPRFNLAVPRSRCAACGATVRARDNVPIASWLLLRGRCRDCGARISARYPVVEAAAGAMGALAAWHFGFGIQAALAALLSWGLLALALIDYDTMLLPDTLTLPLLWLGLAVNLFATFTSLTGAVVGAMAGYLVLWTIYWLFKLTTGKEGMGYGDFKLLAALGAWLGWPLLPAIIVGAAGVGSVVGLLLVALGGHERGKPIPFGPYLAAAGWLCLLWGDRVAGLLGGGP